MGKKEYIERGALLDDLFYALCDGEQRAATYADLKDLINGIPAADVAPVRRWIPASERLPKQKGTYYVTIKEIGTENYTTGVCDFDPIPYGGIWSVKAPVVAWMPYERPNPWVPSHAHG